MRISAVGNEADRRWRRPLGVTLLELVIVLALISLLVALVAPQFANWIDEWRLRSAAERMAQAIRYARTRAVFEQNYYVVEIDAKADRVQVLDAATNTVRQFALPSGTRIDDGEEPRPALVRLLIPPSGDLEERNLWLTDHRGRQFRIHVDFLQGSAAVEAVKRGSK
jgi:prepilin-type N-terminal cleavage/methylation domain-containing protein